MEYIKRNYPSDFHTVVTDDHYKIYYQLKNHSDNLPNLGEQRYIISKYFL